MARFMRKGKTRVWFAPTLTINAPTAAQINAGTRLDTELAEVNGFTFANSPIDTPDMATAFVSKINGEDAVDDSNLVLYESDAGAAGIQTTLAKGVTGYICFFYKGIAGALPAAADTVESWPVTVASNARQYTADNEAAKYQVTFTPTAAPVAAALV